MTHKLTRLLQPNSIAVFGGGWSERVVEQSLQMGFQGDIWPVHPTKDKIAGLPCFASVDDLPAAPDASFIGVNRQATIDIVGALARRGGGGAVCFASGFREVRDGESLEQQLVDAAGEMPILGPNCYGLINYRAGALLWPDQHGGRRCNTGVAIIAQSSNVAINLTMQNRGLPISYILTVGNQAQTGMAEMIDAVLDDPKVTAIGLHIEGFRDIRAIETALAKARRQKVPVIALKVGISDAAQRMTVSHTASLAGVDDLVAAFFQRMNVARVLSLDDFLETLKLLHTLGPSPDYSIGSLSCSGGEASLMADLADVEGMDLRPLTSGEALKVAATLPDRVTISNPLDYHTFTWGNGDSLRETYAAMLDCGFGLTCLVLDAPRPDRCSDNGSELAIRAAIDAAHRTKGRLAIVSSLAENMTEAMADRLMREGIAPLMGMRSALRAAAVAAQIGKGFSAPVPAPLFLSDAKVDTGFETVNEWDAKQILQAHGIQTPQGFVKTTVDEAVSAANAIGYPVVLKVVSSEMAHKTELGVVKLNLTNETEVREAAQDLIAHNAPLLIEKMVENPVGDLILGVARDTQFGLYLTLGAGGIAVEIWKDANVILLPATRDEIFKAILSLKSSPLFTGFRGKPAADLSAVVDAAEALAAYAIAQGPYLEELDINPLMACETGAYAADALIVRRKMKDDISDQDPSQWRHFRDHIGPAQRQYD